MCVIQVYLEQELPTLPGHMSSLTCISGVRVARCLFFYLMYCVSLFFHLSFLFGPLYFLPFGNSCSKYTCMTHIVHSSNSYYLITDFLGGRYGFIWIQKSSILTLAIIVLLFILMFIFLFNVLCIIVFPFVLFIWAIVFSALRFATSNYTVCLVSSIFS
jgi:hypothetical protein